MRVGSTPTSEANFLPAGGIRLVPSEGIVRLFDSVSGDHAGIVPVAARIFGKDQVMVRFHLLAPICPASFADEAAAL